LNAVCTRVLEGCLTALCSLHICLVGITFWRLVSTPHSPSATSRTMGLWYKVTVLQVNWCWHGTVPLDSVHLWSAVYSWTE
jgi:hypothetical protein